jgi:hypothetical protein
LQIDNYPFCIEITLFDNDDIPHWNEICIQTLELFGLPGNRYITGTSRDFMRFYFKEEHDALLFKLKFSEFSY